MNIALPTILVFLIVLPGFLFRSRLKRAEQTSLDYSPFGRVVTGAFLWAVALHCAWLGIAAAIGSPLQSDVLLRLMWLPSNQSDATVAAVQASAPRILVYFASLYLVAFVVPTGLRWGISRWRLDCQGTRFSAVFRFHDAPWYYLLTGADFEKDAQPDYIQIAAIVDAAGTPTLYVGVLTKFFFDPTGQLDRVVLTNVQRRELASDRSVDHGAADQERRFYEIVGDYFVIRYAEAITFNVQYVKLRRRGEAAAIGDPAPPVAVIAA